MQYIILGKTKSSSIPALILKSRKVQRAILAYLQVLEFLKQSSSLCSLYSVSPWQTSRKGNISVVDENKHLGNLL